MIYGTGVDIAQVSRFTPWIENSGLLRRFFHSEEIETVLSRGTSGAASLAARFAAKEAYGKALGMGLRGINLREIRVSLNEKGKPELLLEGRAREQYESLALKAVHLSLSHDGGMAIAMVVLER
jgi:holo-[acyl-carrier protein] synthase